MKCVVAMMQHETNTFSPLPTPLSAFGSVVGLNLPPGGNQAIESYGAADFAFAGMLDAIRERGDEAVVPITAYAEPSGKVDDDAFDYICEKICAAVKQNCDALFLDLHGAMVTQSFDDGEGELLRRIRAARPQLPVAVALDFHTNLTAEMVENCNVLDGYRTYPHIDMYATGRRAAATLLGILDQGMETRICWKTLPMMTHMIRQTPAQQPMKDIMDLAIEAVASTEILNASVFGGFPLADIPHVSLSVVTIEAVDNDLGTGLVNQLCNMAWEKRHEFVFQPESLSESIRKAKQYQSFPVVIADHGDNCGAGGSADDMTVLDEMLQQGMTSIVAGPFWDPESVALMISSGIGSEVCLTICGNTAVPSIGQNGHGLNCTGRVLNITDGRYTVTGPMQTGLEIRLGRTVVLDTGHAKIILAEQRWEPYDPGFFVHTGLDPKDFKYILIKSRQHFRAGFESIASHIVLAAGPGVCSSDYSQFNFTRLARPIFPIDADMMLDISHDSHDSQEI